MKKVFLTLLMVVCTMSAMAIDLPKQGFGMHIGFAAPTLRLNDKSSLIAKDSLVNVTKLNGLKVGVVYDASYFAGFGSTLGINYTFGTSSTKWTQKDLSHSIRNKTLYQEVEVYVDWQYKFEVAKETYLMLYTGPSIQCGIAFNKNTYVRDEVSKTIKETNKELYTTDSADELLKRVNVTWGIGAGFQYQRYFLRGGYDFGIINPYKNAQFEGTDRYTRGRLDQWSIKIGMYFLYK